MHDLSPNDRLEISDLYAHHFYSLDALGGGNSSRDWAETFTPDGVFSIVRAGGERLFEVRGTTELIAAYATFPAVETTRHWMNNMFVAAADGGARGGCYIIAIDIKTFPARIIRSGVYEDELVYTGGKWKFNRRTLILDRNSPAG